MKEKETLFGYKLQSLIVFDMIINQCYVVHIYSMEKIHLRGDQNVFGIFLFAKKERDAGIDAKMAGSDARIGAETA